MLLGAGVGRVSGRGAAAGVRKVGPAAVALAAVAWCVCFAMLPSWQGRALYQATSYLQGAALPVTTQPRLLPKAAAEQYGERDDMRHAHLVVAPETGALVWSAERKGGLVPRSASRELGVQPLDRVDGTLKVVAAGFSPAVSRVGPGSIKWRAYRRHYFTRLEDPIIVPLHGRRAVALVPYVGYRGFPVRRPYWKGVYVYHQDGRLEDLTPQQAMARPELARSGRLIPERLVRDVAEAYGYRSGALAPWLARGRTVVSDPEGNRQPYLTNLGDGRVKWTTVAHPDGDEKTLSALFLTDAATGHTVIWRPPPQRRLLSNQGAAELARKLPLEWEADDTELLRVSEPRPVFAGSRLYYLVSIVPTEYYDTPEPVDRTVLVDAAAGRITEVFNHVDPDADDHLRAFFRRARRDVKT
jgi:hypothetical protein